jgi:hypothetical protein
MGYILSSAQEHNDLRNQIITIPDSSHSFELITVQELKKLQAILWLETE